jgi:ubiquinone/menaquinone biosynthesis C-methylase UbiE
MRTLNNISIEQNIAPGIDLLPIIGETAWHEVTVDPSIVEVSEQHFKQLSIDLKEYGMLKPKLKILEVAAYSHITGYLLASKLNANVTLFDVSSATLRLGRDIAHESGLPSGDVRRVAGDFHQLPFNDNEFDVVYISSALHHTWRWHYVLAELLRVTKTNGLLILENEPCKRELCFYRFRTNRADNFTETEEWLDKHGLLRTVAEPYLGSRNEQLFGMTENQEIPLGDLLEQLVNNNELLFIKTTPQICMGTLENNLDDALRHMSAKSSLNEKLKKEIYKNDIKSKE